MYIAIMPMLPKLNQKKQDNLKTDIRNEGISDGTPSTVTLVKMNWDTEAVVTLLGCL